MTVKSTAFSQSWGLDPREAPHLRDLVLWVYSSLVALRPVLRREIGAALQRWPQTPCFGEGPAAMLEVVRAVALGFRRPLSEVHRRLLREVLLPMYQVQGVVPHVRDVQ